MVMTDSLVEKESWPFTHKVQNQDYSNEMTYCGKNMYESEKELY